MGEVFIAPLVHQIGQVHLQTSNGFAINGIYPEPFVLFLCRVFGPRQICCLSSARDIALGKRLSTRQTSEHLYLNLEEDPTNTFMDAPNVNKITLIHLLLIKYILNIIVIDFKCFISISHPNQDRARFISFKVLLGPRILKAE